MTIERTTIIWNERRNGIAEMVLHIRPTYTQKALCGAKILTPHYQTGVGITNCPHCIQIVSNTANRDYESLGIYQHGNQWFEPVPPSNERLER
mgnify:FL=1